MLVKSGVLDSASKTPARHVVERFDMLGDAAHLQRPDAPLPLTRRDSPQRATESQSFSCAWLSPAMSAECLRSFGTIRHGRQIAWSHFPVFLSPPKTPERLVVSSGMMIGAPSGIVASIVHLSPVFPKFVSTAPAN
jgi:hypothetical protein